MINNYEYDIKVTMYARKSMTSFQYSFEIAKEFSCQIETYFRLNF